MFLVCFYIFIFLVFIDFSSYYVVGVGVIFVCSWFLIFVKGGFYEIVLKSDKIKCILSVIIVGWVERGSLFMNCSG